MTMTNEEAAATVVGAENAAILQHAGLLRPTPAPQVPPCWTRMPITG
jgi:hypothetical protein